MALGTCHEIDFERLPTLKTFAGNENGGYWADYATPFITIVAMP